MVPLLKRQHWYWLDEETGQVGLLKLLQEPGVVMSSHREMGEIRSPAIWGFHGDGS